MEYIEKSPKQKQPEIASHDFIIYTQNVEGFLITTTITLTMMMTSAEEVHKCNPPSEAEWTAPQHRWGGSTQGTSYEIVPREDNTEKTPLFFEKMKKLP